ncbi:hypothetical protein [Polyangium mundeleinium]|uniref:Uncharacterized protein n=1 Tax=Polyangium mundeleinium TaxID=2995306 RepID=A0ABT5F584_9BACT|nr:hypothetical protein [Polyangium mundeleinium]MDC0749252.1 hypothetical protein [Polyangium mundeleinium]
MPCTRAKAEREIDLSRQLPQLPVLPRARPEAPHFVEATGSPLEQDVSDMPDPLGDDEIGCEH